MIGVGGRMAPFSRTGKDLELKPRNVHRPGTLPLLRGKRAKARIVIFFLNYPPTPRRRRGDRRTQSIIFSFIEGQWDLRQLHGACNWWQFPLQCSLSAFKAAWFQPDQNCTQSCVRSSQETVAVDLTTASLVHAHTVWKS